MIIRSFILPKKNTVFLSAREKQLIKALSEVVHDIGKLYAIQREEGFYTKGLTRGDIEKASLANPDVLSPFTYVTKQDGKLSAIPFYKKYHDLLVPISKKIEKAAELTTNKSFKSYLQARAKALVDGSYKQADIAWLEVKDSNVDFSAGPFERYLDNILFTKRAYQAHVGVVDHQLTEQVEHAKELLYSSAKISFDAHHSTEIPRRGIKILAEYTPATSGYMAEMVFSGEHFPCDLDVMQQYGGRTIIYESQLKYKFDKLHYPIVKALFEKRFITKFSKELLLRGVQWYIILYELGRQLHKFIGARERLKELYGIIDEATGATAGIQHSKHLLVKGIISQDQLEAIMIMHVVWLFSDWLTYQHNHGAENYARANSILLNSYLATGALRESKGISWPNFSRMFFEIEELANNLTRILEQGSYQDAKKLIDQKANLKTFERWNTRLAKIPAQL